MDFKIMKCPVCGAPLDAGPGEKYIICRACDTPLRLNEDATSFLRDPEAFGYGFEKGRQRAKADKAYREELGLTIPQFIELRKWEVIEKKQGANIDVVVGGNPTPMIYNVK